MACHGRLGIKDRLAKWGTISHTTCVLCDGGDESQSDSTLECPFSGWVWQQLLEEDGVIRRPNGFQPRAGMDDSEGQPELGAMLCNLPVSLCIYLPRWGKRNARIFQAKKGVGMLC